MILIRAAEDDRKREIDAIHEACDNRERAAEERATARELAAEERNKQFIKELADQQLEASKRNGEEADRRAQAIVDHRIMEFSICPFTLFAKLGGNSS